MRSVKEVMDEFRKDLEEANDLRLDRDDEDKSPAEQPEDEDE